MRPDVIVMFVCGLVVVLSYGLMVRSGRWRVRGLALYPHAGDLRLDVNHTYTVHIFHGVALQDMRLTRLSTTRGVNDVGQFVWTLDATFEEGGTLWVHTTH